MFTQKRKNYKTFLYAVVILLLCFLILALAWPQDAAESEVSGKGSENLQERTAGLLGIQSDDDATQNDIENPSSGQADDIGALKSNRAEEPAKDDDTLQVQGSDNNLNLNPDYEKKIDDSKKTNMNSSTDSYYLVKRADGAVKIFFVSGKGNAPVELETTSILYDVLGPDDQKLFDDGYRVKTQDELAVLLQDFES